MPAKKQIKEAREKIAAARRGQHHTAETRAAIGRGVRHGKECKVNFATRISREAADKLARVSERDNRPKSQLIERLIIEDLD